MAVEFYNVKTREKVSIPESDVKKVIYRDKANPDARPRYALRAQQAGTNLTKFCNKETFDKIPGNAEEISK
jgi:hypothetical protein